MVDPKKNDSENSNFAKAFGEWFDDLRARGVTADQVIAEEKAFMQDVRTLEKQVADIASKRMLKQIAGADFEAGLDQIIADWEGKHPTETLIGEELTELKELPLYELQRLVNYFTEDEE